MFDARVISVLIASPGDVEKDREKISQAVWEWNIHHASRLGIIFVVKMWERGLAHGGYDPHGGQHLIDDSLLNESDAAIAIMWNTVGSTSYSGKTGSVHEVDVFKQSGRPVFLWMSDVAIPASRADGGRKEVVAYFKKSQSSGMITGTYKSTASLKRLVTETLFDLATRDYNLKTPSVSASEVLDSRVESFFRGSIRRVKNIGHLGLENVSPVVLDVEEVELSSLSGAPPTFGVEAPSGSIEPGASVTSVLLFPSSPSSFIVNVNFLHPNFGKMTESIELSVADSAT